MHLVALDEQPELSVQATVQPKPSTEHLWVESAQSVAGSEHSILQVPPTHFKPLRQVESSVQEAAGAMQVLATLQICVYILQSSVAVTH